MSARPAIGSRVRVTFAPTRPHASGDCSWGEGCMGCPETITGEVAFHYPDGIDVTDPDGYVFTVFDRELGADGRTTLEIL